MTIRLRYAVATGAVALGMVAAAPALAGVGQPADSGGQPPPGAKVVKDSDFVLGKQPAAGTRSTKKSTDFVLGPQPAATPETAVPGKASTVKVQVDKGAKNVAPTKDLGKKNVAVKSDRGNR
jgi:hypothetical protein